MTPEEQARAILEPLVESGAKPDFRKEMLASGVSLRGSIGFEMAVRLATAAFEAGRRDATSLVVAAFAAMVEEADNAG